MPDQVFLLSPANCSGQRAALLLNERAEFHLARKLRSDGAALGEVFSFLSGLYFRGKLTYARAFSQTTPETSRIAVITAGRGLQNPDITITQGDLRAFASVPIDAAEPRYRQPLLTDANHLAQQLPANGRVVLLGSVASNKYVEVLLEAFGQRLVFPQAFVGRGDMSRGGLLLRAVDAGQELEYVPVAGAIRRGSRPEKLLPRNRQRT
jgi:hypothetical protein